MADIDAIAAKHNMSEGQRRVLEKALEGVSVFFTGSAGAGKSYCLKAVIAELRRHKRKVAVTASTGAAAVLIGKDQDLWKKTLKTLYISCCKLCMG